MNKFLGVSLISAFGAMIINSATAWSQQKASLIHYQGAVRLPSGLPVANRKVSVRVSLLEGSETGPILYWEINSVTTNALGLYNFNIGQAENSSSVEGKFFNKIDWRSDRPIYIKIDVDPTGASNWSSSKVSKLSAVPYSLYAENGGTSGYNYWKGLPGNADKTLEQYMERVSTLSGDVEGDIHGTQIKTGAVTVDKVAPGKTNQILITNADGKVEWYSAQGIEATYVDGKTVEGKGTLEDPIRVAYKALNENIAAALKDPTIKNAGEVLKVEVGNVAKEAVKDGVGEDGLSVNTGQDVISVVSNEGSTLKPIVVNYNQEKADLANASL